jgi:hypothetical protein
VAQKTIEGMYDGISTQELDVLSAETCAYLSSTHPDFSTLGARILVSNLHRARMCQKVCLKNVVE